MLHCNKHWPSALCQLVRGPTRKQEWTRGREAQNPPWGRWPGVAPSGSNRPTLPGLFHVGKPLVFVEEKGCAERQCVLLNFSATLGTNMMFAYGHQCCSSELCNTRDFQGELEFPPLLTELLPLPPEKLPVTRLL